MGNVFKNWRTTIIGIIALLGLAYNFYNNGGIDVTDFLLLVAGVGFIAVKDPKSKKKDSIGDDLGDPDEEEEPV